MTGLLIAATVLTALTFYGLREHASWVPPVPQPERSLLAQHFEAFGRGVEEAARLIGEALVPAFERIADAARRLGFADLEENK